MEVTEFQNLVQELLYGQAWFLPFLLIATVCIVLVKVERYSAMFVIPCLLVLEGLYFSHIADEPSLVWAMIASLLLIFFVAAVAILEKDKH